jgi:hypothetical protein
MQGNRRKPDVRNWSVFLFLSAAADSAASGPPNAEAVAKLERDGRSLVVACEFKRAARGLRRNSQRYRYLLRKTPVERDATSKKLSNAIPRTTNTCWSCSTYKWTRRNGSTERCREPRHSWNAPRNPIRNHGIQESPIPGRSITDRGGGRGGQSCGRRAPFDTPSRSDSHE